MDQAITEARRIARQIDTNGARRQVRQLEEQRQQHLDQLAKREEWIEDHADLLHTYTAVQDELHARTTALAISYQLKPPEDVLEALGPRPTNTIDAIRWDGAVAHHAAARIRIGPEADLTDATILEAAPWRDAIDAYHPRSELKRGPVLRLVG